MGMGMQSKSRVKWKLRIRSGADDGFVKFESNYMLVVAEKYNFFDIRID